VACNAEDPEQKRLGSRMTHSYNWLQAAFRYADGLPRRCGCISTCVAPRQGRKLSILKGFAANGAARMGPAIVCPEQKTAERN
jgi:hypothetical protein